MKVKSFSGPGDVALKRRSDPVVAGGQFCLGVQVAHAAIDKRQKSR